MDRVEILIVEDELLTVELIRQSLESGGFKVMGAASSAKEALAMIKKRRPGLVLMDVRIKGDMDGVDLAGIVNERYDVPVIYITAFSNSEIIARAKKTRSYGYIIKPFSDQELLTTVEIGLNKHANDVKLRSSEERYRSLWENIGEALFLHRKSGSLVDCNPAMEQLLGHSREVLMAMNMKDLFASPSDWRRYSRELAKGSVVGDFEVDVERGDGAVIRCLVRANVKPGIHGGKDVVEGTLRDVTERRRMEDALRRSEEQYRQLVENLNDVIFTLNTTGVITYMSPVIERMSGYRLDDVVGRNFRDLVHPEDLPDLEARFARTLSSELDSFEFRVVDRDGSVRHVRTSSRAVAVKGKVTGLTGLMTDITERRRMEEALKESESRYRAIFDGSMYLVYVYDLQGRFIDANDATLEFFGYSREDIPSLSFADVLSGEDLEKAYSQAASVITSRSRSTVTEYSVRTRSGEVRCVEATASLLSHHGRSEAILGVGRDITERRKALEELRHANMEKTHLLNSITSILIGVSTKDVITHWNHMAEITFGISRDEAQGKKISGFSLDWDWSEIFTGISTCILDNRPVNVSDVRFRDKNGNDGLLGISITPITGDGGSLEGFLVFGKDITEKRLMERQLQQSAKMATIGEIATGIAHELNQPLNVIKTASQFLMDSIKEKYYTEEFLEERVGKIIAQTDRAAHIITHLRDFGRKSDEDFKPGHPNVPVQVALDLMAEQLKLRSIQVHYRLMDGLPEIMGDATKLEQVFINLAVNARDAFEEMDGSGHDPVITVSSIFDKKSNQVRIDFADNGPGMPADIVDKIFEPFFTTKEVGRGTGLGLSISYNIIKAHKGEITVDSGPEGTVFHIALPAAGSGTT
ncbi:MAG: PAS domain S-box protein [Spirochaetes bacterium]|nr:PAS domain S-box protein [Spirochaetota bacterium]